MKVEVEAAHIVALEQRADQTAAWLTVALSKRKGKTLTITQDDLEATQGSNVRYDIVDGETVLTYEAP